MQKTVPELFDVIDTPIPPGCLACKEQWLTDIYCVGEIMVVREIKSNLKHQRLNFFLPNKEVLRVVTSRKHPGTYHVGLRDSDEGRHQVTRDDAICFVLDNLPFD